MIPRLAIAAILAGGIYYLIARAVIRDIVHRHLDRSSP